MSKDALQRAVERAGGQTKLAAAIRERMPESKVSQVHVWGWLNAVKAPCPPAEYVIPICDALEWRMTPHELRPDLYPHPTDGMPKSASIEMAAAEQAAA